MNAKKERPGGDWSLWMGSLKLISYSELCIRLRHMLLVIFDALNHFFPPDSFEDIAVQRNAPVVFLKRTFPFY